VRLKRRSRGSRRGSQEGKAAGIMAGDLGLFLLRGRGTREEEGEADRRASVVREGRGDACAALRARSWAAGRAGLLRCAGEKAGPHAGSGPGREGEEGETGWLLGAGPRVGRKERELGWVVGWVWAGLVWVLGLVLFYFLSPFFSKLHPNLFESKLNFEFKPYPLNKIKHMHQHECTNIFKPMLKF